MKNGNRPTDSILAVKENTEMPQNIDISNVLQRQKPVR